MTETTAADYLDDIAETIESMDGDRMEILEYMVDLGTELDELPRAERLPGDQVPGCISNVHITAHLDADGQLVFRGSSDSLIVRGFVRALVHAFTGWTPARFVSDALAMVDSFLTRTDLGSAAVPSRTNALGNITMLMKQKALELSAA